MVDTMTTWHLLLGEWDFDWSVVIGCAMLLSLYFWKIRATNLRRITYSLGVAILFIALQSSIDTLGDTYLFSAHMLQHLLLILIVPPLMLLGIPRSTAESWMKVPIIRKAESILGRPSVAWWSCMGCMSIWHLPVLYNAALANEGLHIFQHLTFLITGTMFWWPIVSPIPERRLPTLSAIFYLFAAVAENTILGIIITFMPVGYYPAYLNPPDPIGALGLIRNQWGLSAAGDQKLGGLLMWVPGCSVYFVAILLEIATWYSTPDAPYESTPELGTKVPGVV